MFRNKMEADVEDNSVFESTMSSFNPKDSRSGFQSNVNGLASLNLSENDNHGDVFDESVMLRYTTSLATILTPKTAIRVASQKKPNFSAHTFQESLSDPRNPVNPAACITSTPTLKIAPPIASSTPHCSFIRRQIENSTGSLLYPESSSEYVPDENYKKRIERLARKVKCEEDYTEQSKRKIAYWKRREYQRYSMNELCAHALLVISYARLETYKELVTRLTAQHRMSYTPPPLARSMRATFTIYSMQINLCRGYYLSAPDCGNDYVFLVVFLTGEKVVATEIIQGNDEENIRSRRLRVDEPIHLSGLPLNFQIKLEIYALKIISRPSKSPKEFAKKAFNFIGQCRGPASPHNAEDDSDEYDNTFTLVGHAHLTRQTNGHKSFLITENEYPLDGSMEVKWDVSPHPEELTKEMQGYWILSGNSNLTKMWVKMVNGIIQFYDHSEESVSSFIDPNFIIDMSTIWNRKVERDFQALRNAENEFTFYFDVISFPLGSDMCEHKRFSVAVESEEMLQKWLEKINNCLEVIREPPC